MAVVSSSDSRPQPPSTSPSLSETTKATSRPAFAPSSTSLSIVPSLLAGYASGICAVVVGHPMDSAKVWLQTNTHSRLGHHFGHSMLFSTRVPSPRTNNNNSSVASMSTLASSVSSHGHCQQQRSPPRPSSSCKKSWPSPSASSSWRTIRALYSGITGPLLTVGAIQSINFAIYETTRREIFRIQQQPHGDDWNRFYDRYGDPLWNVAMAGAMSGVFLSGLTAPILLIKTASQVHGIGFRQAFLEQVMGVTSTAVSPNKHQNLLARPRFLPPWLRVGFGIHCLIEILSRAVYYSTYEGCKRFLLQHRIQQRNVSGNSDTPKDHWNTLAERMMSAAVAGIVCWAIIFPLDSIRSRVYAQLAATTTITSNSSSGSNSARALLQSSSSSSSSTHLLAAWDMAKLMYHQPQHDGLNHQPNFPLRQLRPFFRGFGVTVLRAGPVAATALPVYDLVLERLTSSGYF